MPAAFERFEPHLKKHLEIRVIPRFNNRHQITGIIHIARDIGDWKRTMERLKNSRKELRNLTTHLFTVREEERAHIAREIHDELAQTLTTLKLDLLSLDKRLPKNQKSLHKTTKSMSKLIEMSIRTVQEISSDLRPRLLDDLGLKASLNWYAKKIKKQGGITCELVLDFEEANLDQIRTITVFRIIQEAITNVVRHAHATKARASLIENGNSLKIEVKDNGIGITQKQISDSESLGIIGLRERVYLCEGKVEIKGTQNKGTTVSVCIPLDKSLKKNIQNAQNAKDNQEGDNC
jgi:signal transduction histidine kinase